MTRQISQRVLAKRIRETAKEDVVAAFELQSSYSSILKRRGCKSEDSFLRSANFPHFVKLSRFGREVHIPNLSLYLKIMVAANRRPNTWTNDHSYRIFLETMNSQTAANEMIEISAKTIQSLAEKNEMRVPVYVLLMGVGEMLQLIRQRRLSPWIVLNSDLFKRKIQESTPEEKEVIAKLIDADYWTVIMKDNGSALALARRASEALEI